MTDRQDTTKRTERVKQALAEAKTLNELSISLRLGGVWATVRTGVAEVWVQDEAGGVRWVLWLGKDGHWRGADRDVPASGGTLAMLAGAVGEHARWCPVNVGGGV